MRVSPFRIDFGRVEKNESLTKAFTITNTSSVELAVTHVEFEGADGSVFSSDITDMIRLAPSKFEGYRVTFTPTEDKIYSSRMLVHSDAPDSPFKVDLSGLGGDVVSVGAVSSPNGFLLGSPAPNPLAPGINLTVPVSVPTGSDIRIEIVDAIGAVRSIAYDGNDPGETLSIPAQAFDGLPAGLYFLRLSGSSSTGKHAVLTQKIILR